MNATVRTALLFGVLLLAVVGGSYWYSQALHRDDPATPAPTPGPSGPAMPPVGELHEGLQQGFAALKENRVEDAISGFESVPKSDSGYLIALKNLGAAYGTQGRHEEALARFAEILEFQPSQPASYVDLAWAQFRNGQPAEAELSALRALELEPDNVAWRYSTALFRVLNSDLERAIPTYHRAILADSSRQGLRQAVEDLTALHEAQVAIPEIHYALAFFGRTLGRRELEIDELEHYLETAPDGSAAAVARQRLAEARDAAP